MAFLIGLSEEKRGLLVGFNFEPPAREAVIAFAAILDLNKPLNCMPRYGLAPSETQ